MAEPIRVEQWIRSAPETVYALVSDLPRMGEWSPENDGGRWLRAGGPQVGARFVGRNRNGWRRWPTMSVVQVAEPGRRFAFRVTVLGLPISVWDYRFEAVDGGCRVVESWTDLRPGPAAALGGVATGVADRTTANRDAMAQTLAALKSTAEAD